MNGRPAELGQRADPDRDQISLDGRPIRPAAKHFYVALHKPRGVLSVSESPDARRTVRDLVPVEGHLYPVGRLDVDSEGLVLLTNDGELANHLTHPRYGHQKEYRVLVARRPDAEQLDAWRRGVVFDDGTRSAPAAVEVQATSGRGAWLRVTMGEGKKRQIRETGRLLGLPVVRIIRVRIGTLRLGSLRASQWRHLTAQEVETLRGGRKG